MAATKHEVVWRSGKPINWLKPPKANRRVKWTKRDMYGREVTGSFYHICHLNRLNNLAVKRFGVEIVIIQPPFNKTVPASAGTHDFDMVDDLFIPGVSWWDQQRFFRANGFWCWYRHAPLFGNHIHGGSIPPHTGNSLSDYERGGFKVGVYVPGQLQDYYIHAFGLSGQHTPGIDKSWFPKNIEATIFDLDKYVKFRAKKQRKAA